MARFEIDRLITLLSKVPGLGQRSARRAALALLQDAETRLVPLGEAMLAAGRAVRRCQICGNLDAGDECLICSNPARAIGVICVVERVGDLWALERSRVHQGRYHVLGGTLAEGIDIAPLVARVERGEVREVILALSATVDGASTAHLIAERLEECSGVTVTRVGQGVPMGGALDVLDDGTLAMAFRGRRTTA